MKTGCRDNEICENLEGGYRCYNPDQRPIMQEISTVRYRNNAKLRKRTKNESHLALSETKTKEASEPKESEEVVNTTTTATPLCPKGWIPSASGTCTGEKAIENRETLTGC